MKHFNYIKLGRNSAYFRSCLDQNYVQLGFGLNKPNFFESFLNEDWSSLKKLYLQQEDSTRRAGNFIGQLKRARSADESYVWLTIEKGHLYWAQTAKNAKWKSNGEGATLEVKPWSNKDTSNEKTLLSDRRLPGWLMATSQYKGTICNAARNIEIADENTRADVIKRLIGGNISLARTNLRTNEQKLQASIKTALTELDPKDFELLIELIFSRSGWRRVGILGKTQKSIDLRLELPTTGERAIVQVKSSSPKATFNNFLKEVVDTWGDCEKFFWVQHSGDIPVAATEYPEVFIWDTEKIAQQVLESGLVSWLGNKI
jgi:hypothetical protein